MNSDNTPNATSLPESPDGQSRFSLPDGLNPNQSGQDLAHANHLAAPDLEKAQPTNDTCGLPSPSSSNPASLQSSLASRLRARLDVNGSPEYLLIWKEWAISGQEPICALRASARPTSGNDSTGWQTPTVQDAHGRDRHNQKNGTVILSLLGQSRLAGWVTPQAHDVSGRSQNQKAKHGTKHGCACLVNQAQLAGWPTPQANKQTKNSKDPKKLKENGVQTALADAAWLAGETPPSSPCGTENRAALNPAHSRWLMGFPVAWDSCGAMAMQSCRKSRPNLSARG